MSTVDWCRHCFNDGVMTLEHLPARSAGNDQPMHMRDDTGEILRDFLDGHAIPTLCGDCNGGASKRNLPAAYKLWRNDVIDAVRSATAKNARGRDFNIWRTGMVVGVDHTYALHPGRVIRQVLGMVLAVQATRDLVDRHPQLREAYFSEGASSIEPLTLHVALANTNFSYFKTELMTMETDLRTGDFCATPMHMWCFTPFVAVLVEGDKAPWAALRIDHWLQYPTSYHFRRRDRRVSYPIADRSDALISRLYEGSAY
jgi:hypothetical protein